MRRRLVRASLALSLATAAPFAAAQTAATASERPLDDALQGAARDAYASAKILFNNSDFEGAATKYAQAYDLSKDARLLFNLAICEKNLRHYARTQGLLQQYERDMGAHLPADDRATVDAALAAIKSLVGSVKLEVNEAGASVSVDGQPAGGTPLAAPLVLDLGRHALIIKKEGFAAADQTVDVAGGNETTVAITLAAVVHAAHLVVVAEPDAIVTIDGKPEGKGRFDGRVATGAHSVLVTEPDRTPYRTEIDLKDDETRTLSVTLESEKHGAVWPWIVGGAVLAAGAAVGGDFLFRSQPQAAPPPPDQLGSLQLSGWMAR